MDPTTSLVISADHPQDPSALCLGFLAALKGLPSTYAPPSDDLATTPCVTHGRLRVMGFWPCLDYICDIRPYPEILPDTPVKRAVIRSLVSQLLTDATVLGQLSTLYVVQLARSHRDDSNRPTLLDLAVSSRHVHPLAEDYPWVANTLTHVRNHFTNPAWSHT